MHARVATYQGKPEKIEDGIRYIRDQALPAAKKISGFKGLYYFVDRKSGKGYSFALFESEEALRASEDAANKLRAEAAQAGGATIVSVERFEVPVYSEAPVRV